jgi:hypothetical protein
MVSRLKAKISLSGLGDKNDLAVMATLNSPLNI